MRDGRRSNHYVKPNERDKENIQTVFLVDYLIEECVHLYSRQSVNHGGMFTTRAAPCTVHMVICYFSMSKKKFNSKSSVCLGFYSLSVWQIRFIHSFIQFDRYFSPMYFVYTHYRLFVTLERQRKRDQIVGQPDELSNEWLMLNGRAITFYRKLFHFISFLSKHRHHALIH